jgi:hypothetical protein
VEAIANIITNTRASVISITMRGIQAYGRNVKSAGIWLGTMSLRLIFMIPTMYQDINCFFVMGLKTVQKK